MSSTDCMIAEPTLSPSPYAPRCFLPISFRQVLRVHSQRYLEDLHDACRKAGPTINRLSPLRARPGKSNERGDTFVSDSSFLAASVGFAGVLQAVDAVMEGRYKNAFVACRPPGHHAGHHGLPIFPYSSRLGAGFGFCLLNFVSGGAKHAVERWGLQRVTVVDFDLHHGES